MSRIGKSVETESRLVVALHWGLGVTASGSKVSVHIDENVLKWIVVVFAQL